MGRKKQGTSIQKRQREQKKAERREDRQKRRIARAEGAASGAETHHPSPPDVDAPEAGPEEGFGVVPPSST